MNPFLWKTQKIYTMQVRTDDSSFHPHAAAVFKFRFLNRASLNDPFNLLKLSQRASTCIRCGFILGHTPLFGLRAPTASVSTRQDQFSAIKMQEGILLHPVLKTRTPNFKLHRGWEVFTEREWHVTKLRNCKSAARECKCVESVGWVSVGTEAIL